MDISERPLYQELLNQKILPVASLDKAVKESDASGVTLVSYLTSNLVVPEEKLLDILAQVMRVPLVNLKEMTISEAAIKAVPVKFAWYYLFLPVKLEGKRLTIAVSSPLNVRVQDEIRLNLHYEISVVLARHAQITEMLKRYYGLGAETVDQMVSKGEAQVEIKDVGYDAHVLDGGEKLAEAASVIKLVNQIVLEAFKKRATDIHVEPMRGKLRLRYRIDGVLHDQNVPENLRHFLLPILSRLKIMAGLDISERRVPQDGKTVVKTQEQVLDLRLSFIPTPHGESVVIRLLPRRAGFELDSLGLSEKDRVFLESLIKKPSGIVFVTGPTGSGKTTTLYACLKKIDKVEKKVIAIEDPIEYEIEDVTQIQVSPEAGLTFATGLRSILRHDPDIIMVGEVRDRETADIAIRVALTGHLVLSTLHTSDAATGITRLIDIGIEPYLIASSVDVFIAQRLVRVICPHCKAENRDADGALKQSIIHSLNMSPNASIKIYKGQGCQQCDGTGYHGRVALYEFLLVDKWIKRLITEKATAPDIKLAAMKRGMRTLMQDGWSKVINGITTPEEVLEVCHDAELAVGGAEESASVSSDNLNIMKEEPVVEPMPEYSNQRVHTRIGKKVGVWMRIIEKGKGDILRINNDEAGRPDAVFSDKLLEKIDIKDIKEIVCVTSDLSAGGMSIESPYFIPIGSAIEVKFSLPESKETLQCLAKVVRVDKNLPKGFVVAVCYLDLTGAMRARIESFVKNELTRTRQAGSES